MSYKTILETQTTYTNTNPHTVVENVHYLNKQLDAIIEDLNKSVMYKQTINMVDNNNVNVVMNVLTNIKYESNTNISYNDLIKLIKVGYICFIGEIENNAPLKYICEIDEENGLYINDIDGTNYLSSYKPTTIIIY